METVEVMLDNDLLEQIDRAAAREGVSRDEIACKLMLLSIDKRQNESTT